MSERYITLPTGRAVSLATYVNAWRTLKALPPDECVKGWDWHPIEARYILARMRAGMQDRINTRAGIEVRECSANRHFIKWQAARKRGALVPLCRYCGDALSGYVNPNAPRRCEDCARL